MVKDLEGGDEAAIKKYLSKYVPLNLCNYLKGYNILGRTKWRRTLTL